MFHKSISPLIFFIFLILCNTSLLFSVEITLFSLDYNDNGDTKINILHNPVYDEEQIKKDAEELKRLEQTTPKMVQLLSEFDPLIKKVQEEANKAILSTKKTETNIAAKQIELQKIALDVKKYLGLHAN